MSVNDDVVIDDDETTSKSKFEMPASMRSAYGKWQTWPMWARIVSGIGAGYLSLAVLTSVRHAATGGDDGGAAAATITTAPPSPVAAGVDEPQIGADDALKNLPDLQPIVRILVPDRDVVKLVAAVSKLTADGTSACDLYFGTKLRDDDSVTWAITSLADQQANGGFELPSKQYPIRLFVGAPCDRVAPDVPATTTTTTAPPSPVAGG